MVDRSPAEYYLAQGLTNEAIVATELSPGSLNWAHLLNLVGVFRLSNFPPSPVARDLPAEFQAVYAASVFQSRYYASLMNEYAAIGSNNLYAAELPPFSSELPFVMLASDPNAVTDPLAQTYHEARVAFASRWPNARFVTTEGSSHFIHVQRPELVIQSIQDVVEAVRTGELLAQ
jgi:pimeloyl-ACP methyl ester carboxylesterase